MGCSTTIGEGATGVGTFVMIGVLVVFVVGEIVTGGVVVGVIGVGRADTDGLELGTNDILGC